eukprot:GGOE01014246.1.p1 GENE.GGOE01014246.1~~GGOE01014246.1.p1  ORF type:complete len:333 (-),score=59.66 GGOE01014246.1:166-1164(-)
MNEDSFAPPNTPPESRDAPGANTVVNTTAEWSDYFDAKQNLCLPVAEGEEDTFVVYTAGNGTGPVLVLLHGGGLSAMSFALAVKALKQKARVVAFDLRGHGSTTTGNDTNLSRETLVEDVVRVLSALYAGSIPPIILVGHSLGGAIAVWTAAAHPELPIEGLVVIDVVEGSALESLSHMMAFLDRRPSSFPSLKRAIDWAVTQGGLKNAESARISMPAQLVQRSGHSGDLRWHWRTDLKGSEPYWRGWFEGMSAAFLELKGPTKLLLLAGTDRLDTPLTVAHMQGRFQLGLVYGTGHYMMEDKPTETAQRLLDFHARLAKVALLNAALRNKG